MIRMDVVEPIVYEILVERPMTRTNDQLLYIAYWCKERPNVPFLDFFKNYKKYDCRSYKTIERVRRRLQRKFPELADKKTQLKRYELEQEYKEYALKW